MRKSSRLSSIYDDDGDSTPTEPIIQKPSTTATASSTSTKKFAPTIPAARRKKIVEDEDPAAAKDEKAPAEEKRSNGPNQRPAANQQRPRKPNAAAAAAQNVTVSGPLAMGPAGMIRSGSSSRAGSSGGGVIPGRSTAVSTRLQTTASDFCSEAVQIEEEFAYETGLNPVTVCAKLPDDQVKLPLTEGLLLLQMPPVLPRMVGASATELAPDPISGMFDLPQAEHWPRSVQGHYGKLKQYRSGKLTLELLNGFEMELVPSVEEGKLMNILAVDHEFCQSFNLGRIDHSFVCTPELDK